MREGHGGGQLFPSPEVLDVTRDARGHVSLGSGAHCCLGASVARAEAQVALAALIALPDLQLAVDDPVWRPLVALRGLESLPVSLDGARGG